MMPLFINLVFYSKKMKVLTRAIGLAFYNSRAEETSLSVIIEIVCHLKKKKKKFLNSIVGLLNSQFDIIFVPSGIGSNIVGAFFASRSRARPVGALGTFACPTL